MADNFLNRLARNPYAPIDAASVSWIDEMGNGYDDWRNIIAPAQQQPAPQSWGDLAYGIGTAPMRFGNALVNSLSPYHQNEHPITDPNASNWQVPPLISESWDAINSFGNAYKNGMSEDDMRRNANIAAGLTMGGGGLAARPAGGVGMFAGRLAKTADHEALARAEQMATQGADRRAIWDQTGWFQGPDQKWRFEIDDSGAKLSDWNWNRANDTPGITQESSIGGGLEHPQLWDAYPDIADADMRLMKTLDSGSGGWGRDNRTAYVRGSSEPEARSVGLHEIQHAIQGDEGFARGAGANTFTQQADAQLASKALSWRREMERHQGDLSHRDNLVSEEYAAMGAPDWVPPREARDIAMDYGGNPNDQLEAVRNLYGLDRRTTPYTPREMYNRTAGEVEARNVQTRMNMSADERRATPPWETQDIPDADQIVRMYSNASKEASLPALASGVGYDQDHPYLWPWR